MARGFQRQSPKQLAEGEGDANTKGGPKWRCLALILLLSLVAANLFHGQERYNLQLDSLLSSSQYDIIFPQPHQKSEFRPPGYDYSAPAGRNDKYNLPDPVLKEDPYSKMLVFVLTGRGHFKRRQAIRDSWAKNHSNVLFVVGGPKPDNPKEDIIIERLFQEQKEHNDLLDTIHPESYGSLPYKLHYSFMWIRNQALLPDGDDTGSTSSSQQKKIAKSFDWFLKVDDDVVARLYMLERLLLRQYNPHHPLVIGDIIPVSQPQVEGKWAEDPKFKSTFYPPWSRGSAGYIVSRPVADFVGRTKDLYYYQGEDAGLGIWLDEAYEQFGDGGDLTWIHTPDFDFEMGCSENLLVIGHELNAHEIKQCYQQIGGDRIPPHKSRIHTQEDHVYLHRTPPS